MKNYRGLKIEVQVVERQNVHVKKLALKFPFLASKETAKQGKRKSKKESKFQTDLLLFF